MSNDLVVPGDLDIFPGAPYSDDIVDIAVANLRGDAGWHIAPVRTETITVQSWGGADLPIPSLRVTSVTAARSGATVLTYIADAPGVLYRPGGWPVGAIEVDLTHGYATTPLDLLPVVADYARRASDSRDPDIASRTAGPFSETYRELGAAAGTLTPALRRYAILPIGVA